MAIGLRIEDKLYGAVNLSPWKARIMLILHDSELWETLNNTKTNPMIVPTDATTKGMFDKKDIKAKIFLLDAIKHHVISHVSGKYYAHQM